MNKSIGTPKWVGTVLERSVCALLLLTLSFSVYFHKAQTAASQPGLPKWAFFILGVTSFASVVFSSKRLYAPWMKFVELLNMCMSTLIFSAVYFTFVPMISLFRKISKLSSGNSDEKKDSFWVDKKQTAIDQDFFRRMG